MLRPGDPPPPLTLTDPQGRSVSLPDFSGKHVVLYFYPADDTPGCTKEACSFRDAWAEPSHDVMRAYGAYGEKTLYGRKVIGVIRSTVWIGPDGRVRRHWARVTNAAEHPAKVLAAIRDAA